MLSYRPQCEQASSRGNETVCPGRLLKADIFCVQRREDTLRRSVAPVEFQLEQECSLHNPCIGSQSLALEEVLGT